jgi:DNA-3-methyladenine glycosylase II
MEPGNDIYLEAQRHLARRDPVLKRLIRRVGPCTLRPDTDRFLILVRAIISQMISTKAALSVFGRVEALLGAGNVTPAAVAATEEDQLRGAGLSRHKARALRDLAGRVQNGDLTLDRLHELTEDEIVSQLLPVHGIGRWTAEMFLIFGLGRLNVLPVGDLGLRAGVQEHYELDALPGPEALRELARKWEPYRTVATWYMWRSRGEVPQSE